MWVLGIKGLRRIHCHYRSMQQSVMKVVPLFFGFNQMTAKSPKTFFFLHTQKKDLHLFSGIILKLQFINIKWSILLSKIRAKVNHILSRK